MASRSTGAEPKHSSASRGSSTIGRPAVFSDVLTTTGTPVRSWKASSIRATSGSCSGSTVCTRAVPSTCTTAGIRSRHAASTSCTKSMCGDGMAAAEDRGRVLLEHHRRDRPELLAALDVVEPLEVLDPARVGEQAAVPERARPVLAAALEPGDDAVGGQRLGDLLGDVVGPLEVDAGAPQPVGQRVVVPLAAERGRGHRRAPARPRRRRPAARRRARCPSRRRRAAPRSPRTALRAAVARWRRS